MSCEKILAAQFLKYLFPYFSLVKEAVQRSLCTSLFSLFGFRSFFPFQLRFPVGEVYGTTNTLILIILISLKI